MKKLSSCFYWFRIGQFVSIIGSSAGMIAFAWWIMTKTGSPVALGTAMAVPIFLRTIAGPLVAPFVDRYSRRKLMLWSDFWCFITWILLALYANYANFSLSMAMFIYSLNVLGTAFSDTASSAVVRHLVNDEQLEEASRQSNILHHAAIILGGVLGGILAQKLGASFSFMFNACSFFVGVICTFMIKSNTKPQHKNKINANFGVQEWFLSLKEGFFIIIKAKLVLRLLIFAILMSFIINAQQIGLPLLIKTEKGLDESYFGILKAATGIGVILASFLFAKIAKKLGYVKLSLLGGILSAVGLIFVPVSSVIAIPFLMLFLIGLGDTFCDLPINIAITKGIPSHIQGRFFSLLGLWGGIANALGAFIIGVIFTKYGVTNSMIGAGIIALFIIIIIGFLEGGIVDIIRGKPIIVDDINKKEISL